jgi:hypothetical protein
MKPKDQVKLISKHDW